MKYFGNLIIFNKCLNNLWYWGNLKKGYILNQVKHLLTQKVLSTSLETKDEVFKELDIESFYVLSFIKEEFEQTIDIQANYWK